jgi:hypothetical protein
MTYYRCDGGYAPDTWRHFERRGDLPHGFRRVMFGTRTIKGAGISFEREALIALHIAPIVRARAFDGNGNAIDGPKPPANDIGGNYPARDHARPRAGLRLYRRPAYRGCHQSGVRRAPYLPGRSPDMQKAPKGLLILIRRLLPL